MKGKVTLDSIIAFLKIYLTVACCWPLPPNATKFQRLRRDALRYFCYANTAIYAITMIYTIYKHNNDVLVVMKIGCQLSACMQIPFQILLFAVQQKRLQVGFLFIFLYIQLSNIIQGEDN